MTNTTENPCKYFDGGTCDYKENVGEVTNDFCNSPKCPKTVDEVIESFLKEIEDLNISVPTWVATGNELSYKTSWLLVKKDPDLYDKSATERKRAIIHLMNKTARNAHKHVEKSIRETLAERLKGSKVYKCECELVNLVTEKNRGEYERGLAHHTCQCGISNTLQWDKLEDYSPEKLDKNIESQLKELDTVAKYPKYSGSRRF